MNYEQVLSAKIVFIMEIQLKCKNSQFSPKPAQRDNFQ